MSPVPDRPRQDGPLFHRRTAAVLMTIGVVAFVAFIALRDLAPDFKAWRSVGADAFSRSALGYGAFVETLERLGIPVRISRFRAARSTVAGDILVMAAPDDPATARRAVDIWASDPASARTLLVVLPKWRGQRDAGNPRWVGAMDLLSPQAPAAILDPLAEPFRSVAVTRVAWIGSWTGAEPADWPDLAPVQLMRGHGMIPILSASQGDLIARRDVDDRQIVVISDPDLIGNVSIGNGANAAVAVNLVAGLLGDGGTVVFDETVHGLEAEPSLWRLLVSPRFLPVAIGGLLATAAMAWMASGRFGAPGPRPGRRRGGKRALIEGGAGLLLQCGHGGAALAAYATAVRRDVERRLHVPPGMDPAERGGRLRRLAARRGVADGVDLMDRAEDAGGARPSDSALVEQAAALHRWKREMLDGR